MIIDFSSILFLLHIYYVILIGLFTAGIFLLSVKKDLLEKPVSVIIAARNEEKHIEKLIKALSNQSYPKSLFEVIIVDDRSMDNTYNICLNFEREYSWLKTLQVKNENPQLVGKKGALTLGINNAKHEILAFTDADCVPESEWLTAINSAMTDDTDFLCGYSPLIIESKILRGLKNLERSSIFAVIAGSFGIGWSITSVARNQVYRKSVFDKINGFEGIGHIRSGDDDLLLQKMDKEIRKRKFIFSESAAVPSYDKANRKEMSSLETRRASKWKHYPLSIKIMSLLVMLYYIFLISAIPLSILGIVSLKFFISLLLSKIIIEFTLLLVFLIRIRNTKQLKYFLLAELLYIPYFIYFGIKGTFGKYSWKS